jgi:adenylate cyclase
MRLNPRYPAVYLVQAGWAYHSTGRYEEAVAALKSLLQQNPNFLTAYLHLAVTYVRQWASQLSQDPQTLEQALTVTQKALTLNNALPSAHVMLGYIYLCQKQYDQALVEGERAIALDPHDATGYTLLAVALSYVGKSDEALRMVEQALRRKPLIVDSHLSSIGGAYYLAGRPAEAIAPLRQFIVRYPDILDAHLALVAVYSELGQTADAQKEAAEVLRLNPKFSLAVHKERTPIKDPAVLERHIAALRKAGLK